MRVVEVRSDQYVLVHVSKEEAETTAITKLYGNHHSTCYFSQSCSFRNDLLIIAVQTSKLTWCRLTGRGQELGVDVKQKFQQLALQTGTLPENIIFLPKNGTLTTELNILQLKATSSNFVVLFLFSRVPSCLTSCEKTPSSAAPPLITAGE